MNEEDPPLKVEKYPAGKHPNSIKNLKPYPKGVSGNEGSGKGYSLTAELKHALDKETRVRLIKATIDGAIAREPTPFREVWDRVEGKVPGDMPPGFQDNRTINIIVSTEEAKQLTEGVKGFKIFNRGEEDERQDSKEDTPSQQT